MGKILFVGSFCVAVLLLVSCTPELAKKVGENVQVLQKILPVRNQSETQVIQKVLPVRNQSEVTPPIVVDGPSCGNGRCEEKEAYEICPQDCPRKDPLCASGVCEGGESYESCPQDCGVSDIVGSSCNDGACEPGEDAEYCPKDCADIRPNCGNNICDSWESRETCYADCTGDETGESCSTNSDCGRKEVCNNKKCVSVDCTTDSHCSGCRRCSSNSCVSCGRGPYGCYC